MRRIISPSMLSADFGNLERDTKMIDRSAAEWVHIDVMDGVFVPNISFGFPVMKPIRKATNKILDVHLMITDPIRYVEDFANAGADLINFHLEACDDPQAVIDAIKKTGKKVGITIKPKTPVDALIPYLEQVDMILLMSVEPGFGGQSYIPGSTEKIKKLRTMLDDRGLKTDIEIDGGVGLGNIREVLDAGCNIVVAGSAVFKGDIAESAGKFNKVLEDYQS